MSKFDVLKEIGKNVLDEKAEDVALFFKELIRELFRPNSTIDDIKSYVNPHIDKIIREQTQQGLIYSAGKFRITKVDEEHFALAYEMYFVDKNGKYRQVSNLSPAMEVRNLSVNLQKDLMVHRIISFEIDEPKELSI